MYGIIPKTPQSYFHNFVIVKVSKVADSGSNDN